MPIARGTHVIIRFREGASFPGSERVTACAAVIDLACSYSAAHPLIAMRTHVLENLAFGHGFCCLLRLHRPPPPVAAFLSATRLCTAFCGHSCSVLLSCVVLPSALLPVLSVFGGSPVLYSVFVPRWLPRHQLWPNGTCLFFFRCPHRYFRLGCSYPLYRFADAPAGNGAFPAVTIIRTMLCQPACFTWHMLHVHQPHALREQAKHTLPPLRARFHVVAENLCSSLRVLQTLHNCVCSHVVQTR